MTESLEAAMRRMCEADGSVDVLKWLMDKCGYQKSLTTMDPQAIIYNEARRNLWLSLREIIPREQLMLVENPLREDSTWKDRKVAPPPVEKPLAHQKRKRKEQPQ